ncbi:MAG TPA: MBL fold metallo-hydrolase [Clostridiaceae bacterium]|nr:MBL fold metallo-hydrolase [Clostridiaceae bacterium]
MVGKKDWQIRIFHGHELSTHRGTTYNSYILKDEKTVLIDTIWDIYQEEYVEKLDKEVGLKNIDMIVVQHMEPDHGGGLGYLMSKLPENTPIYCTKNGADTIRKHFNNKNWNFQIVKTGDTVKTGKYELVFVEMTMLHWPDSLLTYVKGANVIFSNDAFGQHYSGAGFFNDEVDSCELYQEAMKYYANILLPYSPLVKRKIEEIKSMNLQIDIIAPAHGVIWRENPMQIIEKYYEWSQNYKEDFVSIVYDTMYDSTRKMAEAIAEGFIESGVKVKLFNASITDRSDLITDLFKSKGIIIGSCTVNNTVMRPIISLLEEIKALRFKDKLAAGFGSYGWSGEAPNIISKRLQEAGLKVPLQPIKVKYRPTEQELLECKEYGKTLAKLL